jgi:MFS family permease
MTGNHHPKEVTEGGTTSEYEAVQEESDEERGHQRRKKVKKDDDNEHPAIQVDPPSKGDKKKKSCEVSTTSTGAPDGGWGWVVVFASFMISLVADGISFSFGIIFLELSTYFNESKSKTAFVGSLFMSIPLLIGPLASALTEKYGCRKITIVSGLVSCTGFVIGTFATSIEHLFIAFSVAGAGLALSYVTSIVIVAYYFEKRRSLATGLAVCGTGFGTFIFAPLTIYLMDEYGWRGTLLIMAGFFLNIVVFGALMRDLPDEEDEEDSDSEEEEGENEGENDSDIAESEESHNQNRQSSIRMDSKRGSSFISNHKFLTSMSSRENNDALSLGSIFPISFSTANDNGKDKPNNNISTSRSGNNCNNILTCFFTRQTSHQPSCSTPFKEDYTHHITATLNDARIPPTMSPSSIKTNTLRQSSSLINIPTFLSHSSSATLDDNQVSIINELSVKKGGVLSRLIQRYPNMLSTLFSSPTHGLNNTFHVRETPVREGLRDILSPTSRIGRPDRIMLSSRTESEVTPDLTPSDIYEMRMKDRNTKEGVSRSSFLSTPFNSDNNLHENTSNTIGSNIVVSNGYANSIPVGNNFHYVPSTVLPVVVQTPSASLHYNNQILSSHSNNTNSVTSPPNTNHIIPAPRVSIRSPQSSSNTIKSPVKKHLNEPRTVLGKRLSVNPMIVTGYRLNSLIPFEHGQSTNPQSRSKLQRGSITYRSAVLNIHRRMHSSATRPRMRSSSCPDMTSQVSVVVSAKSVLLSREKARKRAVERSWRESIKNFLSDVIDISIFKSLKYSLFCFSNLLLYACIDVPYVYIPDHAITSGSSTKEEASFLISLIGMVNTLGIVFVGYIGDKPWLEPTHLYSALICCSGVSVFLIPVLSSYTCLAILSSMYGLTISANYALVSVILVDLISLDKFTIGYGLLLMVQGIASLIGPPFAGWLCDLTGTYDVTFYVTGLCIFVSGAVVLPVANQGICAKRKCCRPFSRGNKRNSGANKQCCSKSDKKVIVVPKVDAEQQVVLIKPEETNCDSSRDVQKKESLTQQESEASSEEIEVPSVQVRMGTENDDEYEIVL